MTMFRALTAFPCEVDGELILIEKNERVSSQWPGLKDSRHLFEPVTGRGSDADTRAACRALDSAGQLIEERKR
jgi:hypothetical protein